MKTKLKRNGGAKRNGGVDREKLRVALRRLRRETLLGILDDAIDVIPAGRLKEVVGEYLPRTELRPDKGLLAEVKRFHQASLRGDYYESFHVDSKNFMEKSSGTETWIAECERLFERCVSGAGRAEPAEVRSSLALLFDLLRRVDSGDDIVFWADEGGAYEVDVDWKKAMPVWFQALAATAGPEEYAREARRAIKDFDEHDRNRHLKQARAAASPEQRQALKALS